jgi:hypothetical protein
MPAQFPRRAAPAAAAPPASSREAFICLTALYYRISTMKLQDGRSWAAGTLQQYRLYAMCSTPKGLVTGQYFTRVVHEPAAGTWHARVTQLRGPSHTNVHHRCASCASRTLYMTIRLFCIV